MRQARLHLPASLRQLPTADGRQSGGPRDQLAGRVKRPFPQRLTIPFIGMARTQARNSRKCLFHMFLIPRPPPTLPSLPRPASCVARVYYSSIAAHAPSQGSREK
eukprot:22525-Pyramimonas_sp.AAC.1